MNSKRIIALLAALIVAIAGALSLGAASASTNDAPGSSASNPIIVTDPSEVPESAVEDETSTYITDNECDTTRSWVRTEPGEEHDAVYETRWTRVAVAEYRVWNTETRTRTFVPAVEEVSHLEYKYKRTVKKYKTEYHFRKFTRTKESHDYGVTWSDYGPWTPYIPETHTSWEPSSAPLGAPAPHSSDNQGKDRWYRQWQAQWDGGTRTVENGTEVEYTDWVTAPPAGEGWIKIDTRKIVDTEFEPAYYTDWTDWTPLASGLLDEPTLPENTGIAEYRLSESSPITVPAVDEYYVEGGEPTLNLTDANWTDLPRDAGPDGWTLVDSRLLKEGFKDPDVVTYYAWSDDKECPTTEPTTEPTLIPPTQVTAKPPTTKKNTSNPSLPNAGGPSGALVGAAIFFTSAGGIALLARRRYKQ